MLAHKKSICRPMNANITNDLRGFFHNTFNALEKCENRFYIYLLINICKSKFRLLIIFAQREYFVRSKFDLVPNEYPTYFQLRHKNVVI